MYELCTVMHYDLKEHGFENCLPEQGLGHSVHDGGNGGVLVMMSGHGLGVAL